MRVGVIARRHRAGLAVAVRAERTEEALFSRAIVKAAAWAMAAVAAWAVAAPARGLTFSLTASPAMDPAAKAAFQVAADEWSRLVVNPITVNISIAYTPMDGNVLGATGAEKMLADYDGYRRSLAAKSTSPADTQAVASLQPVLQPGMLINRTTTSPYGSGSPAPYLIPGSDNDDLILQLTTANAKAVGMLPAAYGDSDGTITFNSNYKWSFSRTGGIASDSYDFVGAAMHEIGHVLGFLCGTEALDGGTVSGTPYGLVTSLDLFRYSTESTAAGASDWTSDARLKYFSLDRGLTDLGGFATGVANGDTWNASHWRMQDPAIGIMDPTLAKGELANIAALDLLAMDVIGYQVTALPEPCTVGVLLAGALVVGLRRRRR